MRRSVALIILGLALIQVSHAQTVRPQSDDYVIGTDVQAVGGGDKAKSSQYILDDTIGEPAVGAGRSDTYDLSSGYRQTSGEAYIAMDCSAATNLGTIEFEGQADGSVVCTVTTDAAAGYSLHWTVATGSGGTATGHMINQFDDLIHAFTPSVPGTPDTWFVDDDDARWGGRLSSASDDADVMWGTDGVSEKWLNVGTGGTVIVTRSSATDVGGSSEILEFRVEIGADKTQPSGTYQTTVTLTAASL